MSKENVISKKEPFARMVKRDHISVGKAWAIRLIAVALSLVVAALVIVAVTKQNPIEVYLGIIDGAVGSKASSARSGPAGFKAAVGYGVLKIQRLRGPGDCPHL